MLAADDSRNSAVPFGNHTFDRQLARALPLLAAARSRKRSVVAAMIAPPKRQQKKAPDPSESVRSGAASVNPSVSGGCNIVASRIFDECADEFDTPSGGAFAARQLFRRGVEAFPNSFIEGGPRDRK